MCGPLRRGPAATDVHLQRMATRHSLQMATIFPKPLPFHPAQDTGLRSGMHVWLPCQASACVAAHLEAGLCPAPLPALT